MPLSYLLRHPQPAFAKPLERVPLVSFALHPVFLRAPLSWGLIGVIARTYHPDSVAPRKRTSPPADRSPAYLPRLHSRPRAQEARIHRHRLPEETVSVLAHRLDFIRSGK